MIPRLTIRPLFNLAPNMSTIGRLHRMGKPSPAERLRQRRKARAAVMRSLDRRDEADLHIAYLMGRHHG